jgi:dihydroorotate dehydrogenase (fumarate)
MELTTRYLGLSLRTPLVASASPLSGTLDGLRRLEDAGAAAVVLFSLFEEQLTLEPAQLQRLLGWSGGSFTEPSAAAAEPARMAMGPLGYLEHVRRAKEALDIPVIASLNGVPDRRWTDYARLVEQAGADALELNLYHVPTDPLASGEEVEAAYLETVRALRPAVRLPVAVKLHPFFSSLAWTAQRLHEAGADALVLFNRFYQPDLDPERRRVRPRLELSTRQDLRLPLRWIAILRGQVGADLAGTSGVHTAEDVLKLVMAGADVAMLCSALLRHGPERLGVIERDLDRWLEAHEHAALSPLRGVMSQERCPDPAAFERAQYMLALHGWEHGAERDQR